jgi:phage shock protein A
MGIMIRMLRLCKADVHGVMDQLEDKGLLLKQYLREMENSLRHKEQQVSALSERIDRLKGQIARHGEEMEKLERDLILALNKEKDDIARMLIRRRRILETGSSNLKEQMEVMTQEKTQLSEKLTHQHLQYETLSARADTYCRQAGRPPVRNGFQSPEQAPFMQRAPSDEEIELELLTRKEALQKGGTP